MADEQGKSTFQHFLEDRLKRSQFHVRVRGRQELQDADVLDSHLGWRTRLRRRITQRATRDLNNYVSWSPNFVGAEVRDFSELTSANKYILIGASRLGDLQMTLRRQSHMTSDLYIEQSLYVVKLHRDPRSFPIYMMEFSYSLADILERIYDGTLDAYGPQNHEIQFEVTHPEMSDLGNGILTSIVPLTDENRSLVIEDILDQLLCKLFDRFLLTVTQDTLVSAWVQSSKPDAAMDQLRITVCVGQRNFDGDGPLIGINDEVLQRKAYSTLNPLGTIFYTTVQEHCFWTSIYFGLHHLQFEAAAKEAQTSAKVRDLSCKFVDILQEPKETLVQTVQDFFHQHDIDISKFEVGSNAALKKIYHTFHSQVSIFDDNKNYFR